MKKCLKIAFSTEKPSDVLQKIIKKLSKDLAIEGMAQAVQDNKISIFVCGVIDDLDHFVDVLYENADKYKINLDDIEIVPFMKERDFRGVFRIVE